MELGRGQTGDKHLKRVMPCRIIYVEHFTAMLCPLVSTRAPGHLMLGHLSQEYPTVDAICKSKWLFCAFIIAGTPQKAPMNYRYSAQGGTRIRFRVPASSFRSCLYRPQV